MDNLRLVALRGATSVEENTKEAIWTATRELVGEVLGRNGFSAKETVSIIFTATPDLNADFPAAAVRDLGFAQVPLLCTQEIAVPGALPRCIRLLLHAYLPLPQDRMRHVYLHKAQVLRTDLNDAQ